MSTPLPPPSGEPLQPPVGQPPPSPLPAPAPQPAGAPVPARPQLTSAEKAKGWQSLGCLLIVGAFLLLLVGGWVSSLFNKSGLRDDQEDAFYACVDVIQRQIGSLKARFPEPETATYTGVDGSWLIRGTYSFPLIDVKYECAATRVSVGNYRVRWDSVK